MTLCILYDMLIGVVFFHIVRGRRDNNIYTIYILPDEPVAGYTLYYVPIIHMHTEMWLHSA